MAFQINLTSEDMFKSDLLEVPGVLQSKAPSHLNTVNDCALARMLSSISRI